MQTTDAPLFELASYRDLFKKAEQDLAKLDKLVNSYDLFNYLCTINHLHDWVEKEVNITPPMRSDGGTLDIIRKLCNRAKHFEKRDAPESSVKKGFGIGRYGVGLCGVGEPSYTVTIEGKEIQVLELCKDAFGLWAIFLKANNLMEEPS